MKQKKKEYSINSSFRLNANLAVLRRKTEKSNKKILGEIVNQLVELLASNVESKYYVVRKSDSIVLQVHAKNHIREVD